MQIYDENNGGAQTFFKKNVEITMIYENILLCLFLLIPLTITSDVKIRRY
jgi:hypothetical protein